MAVEMLPRFLPMSTFERDLAWAREQMPQTRAAIDQLPDLGVMRLAVSAHLDLKTALAIDGLLGHGARIFLTTCNPDTVRDEMVAWCVARGAEAMAWHGMPRDAFDAAVARAVGWGPTHLCEMGAEITCHIAETRDVETRHGASLRIRAGLEATGSGITRLGALAPAYPIFNWDDVPIKEGLHNRHMVGLTTCHAFFERTRLTFHNRRVLIIGFGLVGRGMCDAARAYGGRVLVAELNAARALEARFAGWDVLPLEEALPRADVVITATGARNVIGAAQFGLLKTGAFLLNVGHLNEEIDTGALYALPHETVMPYVERVQLGERRVYLFAAGSMANLGAGQGDSLNAFDITLAVMVAGIGFIAVEGEAYAPGVHTLPEPVWMPVARRAVSG
jgi:adenosylhomocysteinase